MIVRGTIDRDSRHVVEVTIPAFDCRLSLEHGDDVGALVGEWVGLISTHQLGRSLHVDCQVEGDWIEIGASDTGTLLSFLLMRQRQASGLSHREIAARAGLKSHRAIATYEAGDSEPGLAKLQQLLDAMGVEIVIETKKRSKVA